MVGSVWFFLTTTSTLLITFKFLPSLHRNYTCIKLTTGLLIHVIYDFHIFLFVFNFDIFHAHKINSRVTKEPPAAVEELE